MRRAGGWALGAIVVAAMAGGAWLGFRPILNREPIYILVGRGERDPSTDAVQSGLQFALDEAGNRAGPFRVHLVDEKSPLSDKAYLMITFSYSVVVQVDSKRLHHMILKFDDSDDPETLRVLPNLMELATATAAWARQNGTRRVVLLCDELNLMTKYWSERITKAIPLVDVRFYARHQPGKSETKEDWEAVLDQVIGEQPDLVFYFGEEAPYGNAFELFDALRRKGYAGRLAMGDLDPEVSFLAAPTKVVQGTFLVSPIGPPSPEFAAAYEPKTGRHAGPHAWPGYLTMKALLEVLDRADSGKQEQVQSLFQSALKRSRPGALYAFKGGKWEFVQELK
jgi:hypothetical protein